MPLGLVTAIRSVTGGHRASNEDSVACTDALALVADGVGGHQGGDVASWTVTHRLLAALQARTVPDLSRDDVRELVDVANADLAVRVRQDPDLTGMATTFTAVMTTVDGIRLLHLGDSRAYLVGDARTGRVSRDDSLVQLLVDSGRIDPADARTHPQRNLILRSLSGSPRDAVDLRVEDLPTVVGDRWLLCSDGLTDYVEEDEVLAIVAAASDVESAADALIAAAEDADSHDNVSVAVSEVVELSPDAPRADARLAGAAADDRHGRLGDLSA